MATMLQRLAKFRKSDEYEDLDGQAGIDLDITDPVMQQYGGVVPPESEQTANSSALEATAGEPPEGK